MAQLDASAIPAQPQSLSERIPLRHVDVALVGAASEEVEASEVAAGVAAPVSDDGSDCDAGADAPLGVAFSAGALTWVCSSNTN